MGYYERDGFDPTTANDKGPFDEMHTGHLQGNRVYIIDQTKLLERADYTTVTLVNDELDPTKGDALSVVATVKGGQNLRGESAHIYDGEIKVQPSRWVDSFASSIDNSAFQGHHTDLFIGDPNFRILTNGIFDVGIYRDTDSLLVSNEFTLTHGRREYRLVAPAKSEIDPAEQLTYYLSSLMCATFVANNVNHLLMRRPPYMSPFILTPDGPLYRNPDTGEYRHRLDRPSINIESSHSRKLEAPKKGPTLEDLYGIERIIEELEPLIVCFNHPELAEKWGAERPSGIFLTGPAGTGKTTIIEALANTLGGEIYNVKGSEIHDKYLGNSQKMITAVFDKVRDAKVPTILFFDELEGLVTSTDDEGSGSAAINAVAAIFKTETARIAKENPNVVFAAATNYPDRVDPTLIRAGRFDLKLEVNLPDQQARQRIFGNLIISAAAPNRNIAPEHISKVGIDGQADPDTEFRRYSHELLGADAHEQLARITEGFSIADIINVLSKATLRKLTDEAKGKDVGPITIEDLIQIARAYHRK